MRILVTGANGMLGSELVPTLASEHQVVPFTDADADIGIPEQIIPLIRSASPELVIHLAAFTDVDGAESQPASAYRVNALGTRNVVLACGQLNIPIMYISTDYVFDGEKAAPYCEFDTTNPINTYGRSKLAGERFTQSLINNFFIVRTSWLFGPNGKNFVDTVRRLATEIGNLNVVNDQIGSPTFTRHLSWKIREILERGKFGTYHVTNTSSCSWYAFARKILELSGLAGVCLNAITSGQLQRPARRPANSVLDNMVLRLDGFSLLPSWESALEEYLSSASSQRGVEGAVVSGCPSPNGFRVPGFKLTH